MKEESWNGEHFARQSLIDDFEEARRAGEHFDSKAMRSDANDYGTRIPAGYSSPVRFPGAMKP